MIRLEVKDPQVYGEIEWISVQIHGQSFMLHQIVSRRKRRLHRALGSSGSIQGDPRFRQRASSGVWSMIDGGV